MATQQNRLVTFRVCVGDYKPTKIIVDIYIVDKHLPIATVECKSVFRHGLWKSDEILLPTKALCYRYVVETSERSLSRLFIRTVITIPEPTLRSLLPCIEVCSDVLNGGEIQFAPSSLYLGILTHIQSLFGKIRGSHDLKQKLSELEHMWKGCDSKTLNDNSGNDLQSWAVNTLAIFPTYSHKVIFLSVLYGKLVEWKHVHLSDYKSITISGERKILTVLESIGKDDVTSWCFSGLRITALQVLQCVGKDHWLYVAAYFPHLFELTRVQDLKGSTRNIRIDIRDAKNTLIPKVLDKYNDTDAHALLLQLPEEGKKPSDKVKLKELVDAILTPSKTIYLPPGETMQNAESSSMSLARVTRANTVQEKRETRPSIPNSATHCQMPPSETISNTNMKTGSASSLTASSEKSHQEAEARSPKEETISNTNMKTGSASSLTASSEKSHQEAEARSPKEDKVLFQVLIRDKDVTKVRLILQVGSNVTNTSVMDNQTVDQTHFSNKWTLASREVSLSLEMDYQYKYEITVPRLFFSPYIIKEEKTSKVSPPCQVNDIFRFPREYNYIRKPREEAAQASLIYIDKLFPSVCSSTLKQSLIQVEHFRFPGLGAGKQFSKAVTDWVQNMILPHGATTSPLSMSQINFLAVLLGKLISNSYDIDTNSLSDQVVWHLISAFEKAERNDFPTSVFEDLQKVCLWLVTKTNGSWLNLLQYFHGLLDVDRLVKLRKFVKSPRWTLKTWDAGEKHTFEVCIALFVNDTKGMEQLVSCSIEECLDTRVFKAVLDIYYTCSGSSDDTKIVNKAVNQLDDMIKKRWVKDLNRLLIISKDMLLINPKIAEVVRQHIINYLKRETWNFDHRQSIHASILDSKLYRTSEDLVEVIRNMLKQSDPFNVQNLFMDVIRSPEMLKIANRQAIQALLEIGMQSLVSLCRSPKKRDTALLMIYKILAAVSDCEHLSSCKVLQHQMNKQAFAIVKDISLDCFFRSMLHNADSELCPTELHIMAVHIQQLLREDKSRAAESTHHMRQLQDSSGKLMVTSVPMRDVLIAMIDMHEPPMPIEQVSTSGINADIKFENSVIKILQDCEFWLMIFHSEGEYSSFIKQHSHVKNVTETVQLFAKYLLDEYVSIYFVKELPRKQELLQLLEVVLPKTADKTNQWTDCLTHLQTLYDLFQTRKHILYKFFSTCIENSPKCIEVTDAKNLIDHLKKLQQPKMYKLLSVKDTLEECWGPLFPLISFTEKINNCVHSEIFLNLCWSIMDGTCPDINNDKKASEVSNLDHVDKKSTQTETINPEEANIDDINDDCKQNEVEQHECTGQRVLTSVLKQEPINTQALATLITDICIPTFKKHCDILLKGNLDISVRVFENMLKGVSTKKRLEIELNKIQSIFEKPVPKEIIMALENLVELRNLSDRSQQLGSMFSTFEVAKEDDDVLLSAILQLADLQISHTLTLQQLHDALKILLAILKQINHEDWEIIEQLADSQELIAFLRPLVDEDLRNLIDAVEERSEQHVSESTVSDLIDVKRYMEELLKVKQPHHAQNLITAIKNNRNLANKVKKIPTKINSCVCNVHSLRDLYNNVANRGEMTKEIIRNSLQQGVYNFVLDGNSEEGCIVVLTYKQGKSEAMYGLSELNDYRSRALLIVNTCNHSSNFHLEEDKNDHTLLPAPDFERFISCVNTVNAIIDLCTWLRESGHFSFRHFEEKVHKLEELEELRTGLRCMFEHWQAILKEATERFFFLNFFHSKQLWQLEQFFSNDYKVSDDLVLLFRFVNTEIKGNELEDFLKLYTRPKDMLNLKERLFNLGMVLEIIFRERPKSRSIPGQIQMGNMTLDSKVQKGTVFVAELEQESTKSVPVLLRLYSNTTGVLPAPSQIVFCHQGTSWEEISLLLQRCIARGAPDHFKTDTLFALVNVELLSTETQLELVKEVQRVQEEENDFFLAIICRGGSYHHIIDQFSPLYTHCLHGFSDAEMSSCLRTGWPEVEVVTSAQPGLGKTEYIRNVAIQRDLGICTLPISGPITKDKLVKQLKTLNMHSYNILHIDAAPVSDQDLFDTFLFEIVVLGMAVSGTQLCLLPSSKVILEVANTHQDKLRNALTICSSFTRTHLEWTGFSHFIVSKDINSPVQVVCHYLKALNNGTLDTEDIVLTGPAPISPLAPTECCSLLTNLFGSRKMSFNSVNTFLVIFAQELRRMSASLYFTTSNLKAMLGSDSIDVRSQFVRALLEVSTDFTARSVEHHHTEENGGAAALLNYRSGSEVSADQMVARMTGMVKWADSNHLLLVFHRQDSQTISTLYRLLNKVPINIRKLFETQLKRQLEDYNNMSQNQLHTILEKVCRSTRSPFQKEKLEDLQSSYALTPDNLLKMVLIHTRVKSRVPVIIMGETGCGKTTLITYLARVCEVPFEILNLHAGISEQDILNFVSSLQVQAEKNIKEEVWGFLDEINTCDHLGLLNEVICHHSLKGAALPNNLIFLAACNPYCLRISSTESVGLVGKHQHDEMTKLVYRVHPLPETMMDYVWDYGSLDKKDEEAYIRRMLGDNNNTFVDLVMMSQNLLREVEATSYCVSLRDVNRCQYLAKWFGNMLKKKGVAHVQGDSNYNRIDIRSMVLALAHCYHSRLSKAVNRQKYRQNVATILAKEKLYLGLTEYHIEQMIKAEQLDFLERMQLPDGIAKNEALRENVFVILVSILNRIPVFVVGKPGCSKSLSMQLIRSNLRGPDSKDKYFKLLPPVYVVSYQGSESSTSDGIIKIFDKAKNYKKHNPDVMPVVLLDEIGLAERSRFNPLKVLHSQLEPTVGDFPPVAVVGISNWSLDAAKMNRAIHLSRPEPTIHDLADTAKSIRDDIAQKKRQSLSHHIINDDKLRCLAKAYSEYQVNQKHSNFHGLRDYYSLVKYVAIQSTKELQGDSREIIENGILRNFGGLNLEICHIMNTFTTEIGFVQQPDTRSGTIKLIEDNLDDRHARHLMLITSGDSALNILEQTLQDREHVTIFGSRFDNDMSEEYNYTILSEIILCMERGVTLVLRDLESIYGSLYDMLNQNYTVVGKKRNCRVALGPFSNPMCEVHQNFRCIVLVDEQKVDYQNPPFLNRFEKQTLRFSDIISDVQVETIGCLRRWMDDICCVEGFQFTQKAMFLGLHSETLPSLVYQRSRDRDVLSDIHPPELAKQCQNDLLKVACPDAVLRASKSKLAKKNRAEVDRFQTAHFRLSLQNGIRQFYSDYFSNLPDTLNDYGKNSEEKNISVSLGCTRTVLYTHSSIHTNVRQLLDGIVTVRVEKLSRFKSERHFNAQMRQFWLDTSDELLLILQCMTSHDAAHMLLARTRIDQHRKEYLKTIGSSPIIKHVCILVHIDRAENDDVDMYPWQFNFLCGWKQFTVDTLEPNYPPLDDLLHGSISDHLSGTIDLETLIKEQLVWCFSCIKYENQFREVDSALQLAGDIARSNEFLGCLKIHILNFLRELESSTEDMTLELYSGWQVEVATNIDLLYRCSTLTGALTEHIKQCVRKPLAKIIVLLERSNAWSGSPCICNVADDTAEFWLACFDNPVVFDINCKDLPQPRGPESCLVDFNFLELKYPFFKVFHDKIESNKEWLMQQCILSDFDNQDNAMMHASEQLTDMINHMPEIQYEYYLEEHIHDYLDDLYNTFSAKYASHIPSNMRIHVMKWLMVQVVPPENIGVTLTHQLAVNYVTIWSHAEFLAAELQLIIIYSEVSTAEPSRLLEEIQQTLDGIPEHIVKYEKHLDDGKNGSFGVSTSNENLEECEKEASQSRSPIDNFEGSSEQDDDGNFDHDQNRSCDDQCDTSSRNVANKSSISNDEDIEEMLLDENKTPVQMPANPSNEHAETILVTQVCKAVLPVRKVIEASGGLEGWQRRATSVLLLAGRVTGARDSVVLHFLRLCRDFVAMLAHDFNITEDQVTALCDLGMHANDPLANEDVFMFITSAVGKLKHQKEVGHLSLKLDNFITTYFGLCLEANLDTPLLPEIVRALCTDSNLLLHGSRPVLLDILKNDILDNSVPVCEKLIFSEELDVDAFPNLAVVDDILQENELDSNLSAACCDIIEDIAFKHITCDKIAGVTSEDPIWKVASCAVRVLQNQEQVKSSLKFVTAAAFMRSLIKSTAELIEASDTKNFKLNGDYFVLAKILNGLIRFEKDARCKTNVSLIQVFLMKCLRENISLFELRKLCVELTDPITNLGNVKWQKCLFTTRLGYCPMGYVDYYKDAIDALSAWQVKQDRSKISNFIATARSRPAYRLSLLAAAANTFYFVQTTEGLKDVDKQEARWLYDATNEFHDVYRQFFKRILGLSDFTGVLRLSESSSKESIEIASVVVHLTSIVVSHAENDGKTDTAFLSFIDQSTPINQMVLPCTGEPFSVVKTPYTKQLLFYDCTCGLRIVGMKEEDLTSNCPTCHRKKRGNPSVYLTATEESSRSAQMGYNRPVRQTQTTTESVPGLSPVSYRVLDIFLHSCFLAGVSVEFVTKDKMALLLSLPACTAESPPVCQDEASSCEDITPEMSQLSSPDRDIHNYLTKILEENWHLMRDITQTSHEGVTVLIHCLIRACTNEIVTKSVSMSAEDRFALESDFSEIIDIEAQNIPECQMRHKQECLQSESINGECLESKLEESDSCQIDQFQELDDKEKHRELRRLFRRKHNVSFQHFQSRFANTHQTNKDKFPFLQLCLSRLDAIQYIRYLPDLLKWNTLVNGRLSHIIKRDDAKRTKVGEFLSDRRYHPSDTSMAAAQTAFSIFQKAWNHVRGGWYTLTGSEPKFSTMTATNYITQCIVDKNEKDCYLRQMINALKEVQNTFLMDTLAIVTYGYCPALNFLIMNSDRATLPTLSLQAAGDAIIQYEWSDTLLVFHDIDTEYGKGVVINYKFTIIERELARILILNKAILREGTMFIKFTYSDELFHACSAILSEIGTTVLQQKLPKEVVNTIVREQNRHQTFANDMLDHLEVILVLLKKTGGNPCSSLDEYIQRWSTLLPSSFQINLLPEPKDGVKLQNVVHLYETLEDLLVGVVVESLHDDFRKELPKRSIDVLAQKLKPLSIEKLEECAAMVRRFVFRYLRSDTKTNNLDSLKEVMVRSTGETIHCSTFIDLLPDYLEVGHVVKILEFIEKQAEQRSDALRKKDLHQNRPRTRSRAVGGKVRRPRHGGMGGVA